MAKVLYLYQDLDVRLHLEKRGWKSVQGAQNVFITKPSSNDHIRVSEFGTYPVYTKTGNNASLILRR